MAGGFLALAVAVKLRAGQWSDWIEADRSWIEADRSLARSSEHDLSRKPMPAFRDHAL